MTTQDLDLDPPAAEPVAAPVGAASAATREGMTRRQFLVRTAAGGGFMVGCTLPGLGPRLGGAGAAHAAATSYNVTAWIIVGSDESLTIQVPITEMGQGTMTGLAQIVLDQLPTVWSRVRVVHAPVDAAHGGANASPWGRFTGGSLGIRLFSGNMRQAAANARQLLVMAAARAWGITEGECAVQPGAVTATVRGIAQTATFGTLAPLVSNLTLAANAPLVTTRTFVGTSPPRVDIPAKVNGSAKFGIDFFRPGMAFAAVRHSPTLGGTVAAVGGKPAGALAVVPVGALGTPGTAGYRPPNAVAVIAATTWDAMRAVNALNVSWNQPADAANNDTAAINARAAWLMDYGAPIDAPTNLHPENIAAGLAAPNVAIASTYQVPFLAHAALEPLNCTVLFTPSTATSPASCDVWAPTQAPDATAATARALCPAGTAVRVENTLLGGGFGRKFEQDFIREAVQVALAYPNVPVKLTWPREQDFTYDQFRPMGRVRVAAAASKSSGRITAWQYRIVTPSIAVQRGGNPNALDASAVDGASELPYVLDPFQVQYVRHDTTIPVGYWRSVGMSINTFAVESAMDELAASIGWDPIDFRLANLPDGRMKTVLGMLRTLSGWGTTPPSGRARGVAIAHGFGSFVGQVAEISVNATTGAVTVHRVSTVIDCGVAVNPDAITAQIEGAVAQAVAATLWDQQTFVNGVPQVRNYNAYRPLRLSEMPQVNVQIVKSSEASGGVGEPGVPCVAPAIANAYARLRGAAARKRTLPFFPGTTLSGL